MLCKTCVSENRPSFPSWNMRMLPSILNSVSQIQYFYWISLLACFPYFFLILTFYHHHHHLYISICSHWRPIKYWNGCTVSFTIDFIAWAFLVLILQVENIWRNSKISLIFLVANILPEGSSSFQLMQWLFLILE